MMNTVIVVGVCIKSKNNELLMVQEAGKDIKGLLNFPMGKLDEGETIFEGAIREVKEETGFDVKLTSILSIQNYVSEKGGNLIKITFNADIVSGKIEFDKNEIMDVRWIAINELERMTNKELRSYKSLIDIIKDAKDDKQYPLSVIKNIIL